MHSCGAGVDLGDGLTGSQCPMTERTAIRVHPRGGMVQRGLGVSGHTGVCPVLVWQ
jgi:hypothetical protein